MSIWTILPHELRKLTRTILPRGILVPYRYYRYGIFLLFRRFGNNSKNYCPICKKESYFIPTYYAPKLKECPCCGSLERHRLLWLFLQKNTDFFNNKTNKILHVAAEDCFKKRFKKLHGKNYITADLCNPSAMVKMDITNIQYPDEAFDIIICSHVLEHITDDIKAMNEMRRVLKNTGYAILLVPTANIDKTHEDRSITSISGKLKAFGGEDHVRMYGKDYVERLESAGFKVKKYENKDIANEEEIEKMYLKDNNEIHGWGLIKEAEIYYCEK
ncbi:glycosyl transferase [Fibrobacteria bacterium R8-3-H12]